MRLSRSLLTVAATTALVILLSGCSVSISDKTPSEKPAAESSQAPQPETQPSEDADLEEQAPPVASDGIDRETLIAAATTLQRCDGELHITEDAIIVRIEGACDRLILNSKGSMIVTDDVTSLEVIGDGNVVMSGAVDKLLVNGGANVVRWNGATPTVTDVGSGNTLTAG